MVMVIVIIWLDGWTDHATTDGDGDGDGIHEDVEMIRLVSPTLLSCHRQRLRR